MNIISWEQLQNIANNMLKATDNPDELLMIYINKMHSLLLDAPPELHPYMIQGLRDTGMFDDPVLTMFFNQLLSGEVDDVRQPDILNENMRMMEVNGGHIRSKLNKMKNMTAGNPKKSASGTTNDPEKVFTVEEKRTKEEENKRTASNTQSQDIILVEELPQSYPRLTIREDSLLYKSIQFDEQERIEKECDKEKQKLRMVLAEKLSVLDDQLESEKKKILEAFNNKISQINKEYGLNILALALGCYVWHFLRSTPIVETLHFSVVSGTGLSAQMALIFEFILIGGYIGGILKGMFTGHIYLEFTDRSLSTPMQSSSTSIQSLKNGVNHLIDNHPFFHMVKLSYFKKKLLTEDIDIFELPQFKKILDYIREKRQRVIDFYTTEIEELERWCHERIQRIKKTHMTMMHPTSGRKGLGVMEILKPIIVEFDDLSSFKQQQIQDDEKKTNGGMKKISKKYRKKNRKSKY